MTAPEVTEAFQTLRDVCPEFAHGLVDVLERRLIVAESKVAMFERLRIGIVNVTDTAEVIPFPSPGHSVKVGDVT